MTNWLNDIELKGHLVTLTPLKATHKNELLSAAEDGELWNIWYTFVPSPKTIDSYLNTALTEGQNKNQLTFVIIHNATNKIIGTTRYCNIDHSNKRLEIGYTWYAKSHQRTGVNTECKKLLLQHAFETLQCIAVEFKTHWFNYKSRAAIARLGAKQDGILRNHRIDNEGRLRDTVVFSIINLEWPVTKQSLQYEMDKYNVN